MSTTRGIFESFPDQPATRTESTFAGGGESAAPAAAASPFTVAENQDSPFTMVDEAGDSRPVEPGQPAPGPERRGLEFPFQLAEPPEGFGFEAPAPPVSTPPQQAAVSHFSVEPQRGSSPSTQAAIAAFASWQETPAAASTPQAAVVPKAFGQPTASAVQVPSAFAPAPQAAAPVDESTSDSFSIRQLELRAIFGVDRELNPEEILQRSRALPGIRNLARVNPQDMGAVESLKHLLANLGFGSGALKLFSGTVPLEFIREGPVLLAVQTDGGFAPGVRETLMLVARELGRIS